MMPMMRRPLIRQRTSAPTRKVAAGGLGGAVGTIVVWLIELGVEVPAVVAAAIATVCSFGVAYLVRDRLR